MEFTDVVRARRMVRSYDPDRAVDSNQVRQFLHLALRAPSAGNSQGWHFLVLDDITARERFWGATTDPATDAATDADRWLTGMRDAPVLVVCFADRAAYLQRYAEADKAGTGRTPAGSDPWPIPYWHVDTGMAAMTLLLAATDAGLGACFFGVPGERWARLRSTFTVPERLAPVGVVSLGHPAPDRRSPSLRRGRRPYAEVVSYGSFDGSFEPASPTDG